MNEKDSQEWHSKVIWRGTSDTAFECPLEPFVILTYIRTVIPCNRIIKEGAPNRSIYPNCQVTLSVEKQACDKSAADLQEYSGVAPVTERSGKKKLGALALAMSNIYATNIC